MYITKTSEKSFKRVKFQARNYKSGYTHLTETYQDMKAVADMQSRGNNFIIRWS